jgi:hypothetical protein
MRLASIAPSTILPKIGRSFERAYATATATTIWMSQPPNA